MHMSPGTVCDLILPFARTTLNTPQWEESRMPSGPYKLSVQPGTGSLAVDVTTKTIKKFITLFEIGSEFINKTKLPGFNKKFVSLN